VDDINISLDHAATKDIEARRIKTPIIETYGKVYYSRHG
jgi:hypothetical protein